MSDLNFTAQASPVWGDLSGRGQSVIEAIPNRAWVLGTKFNHSTRGQMMIGFWPGTTLNSSPNAALYTASNFIRARVGANTAGLEVPYSAATSYPSIIVWTETGYQVFSKRGGDWFRDWHIRQSDVQNYIGFSNYDAIGALEDRWVCQSHKADLFAFDIDIPSVSVGQNSAAFGELPPYEWYMEFDYVTEPSAGYYQFDFQFYEDLSASVPVFYTIRIDSSSLLEYGINYNGIFSAYAGSPDPAPTITPGSTIRIMIDWDGVRIFENESLVFTWDFDQEYDTFNDYTQNREWAITSLGTGGLIENLKIGKRRLVNEFGLGTDIVVNGDFDTDTDWTKDPEWTIGGNIASVVGDGVADAEMYESGATSLAIGKLYQGSFDVPTATDIGAGFKVVALMNAKIVDSVFTSNIAIGYEVGSFLGRQWQLNTPKIAMRNGKDADADVDNVIVQEVLFTPDELALLFDSMLGI